MAFRAALTAVSRRSQSLLSAGGLAPLAAVAQATQGIAASSSAWTAPSFARNLSAEAVAEVIRAVPARGAAPRGFCRRRRVALAPAAR